MNCAFALDRLDSHMVDSRVERVDSSVRRVFFIMNCAFALDRLDSPMVDSCVERVKLFCQKRVCFLMNCAFAIDRLDCPVVDSRTQRSVDASVREVLKCALAFFQQT